MVTATTTVPDHPDAATGPTASRAAHRGRVPVMRVADAHRSSFLGNAPGMGNGDEAVRSSFPDPCVGNQERPGNDLFVDIRALLDGTLPEPPEPTLLRRSDDHALFYRREVNCLFGEPEAGKTFICMAAIAEAMKAGLRVLVLDLDHNGPHATVARLVAFGVPVEALEDLGRFRYIEPNDRSDLWAVLDDAKRWGPAVALVDSIGELLPALGLSSNSPDDFTLAHSRVLKPLAMTGAAVLAVDHLAKNAESKAAGPTGTTAKRRAIGGLSLRVHATEPFTPGRGGKAVLTVNKDRHGGVRRHCPTGDREPLAGVFILSDDHGDLTGVVAAPRPGETAPQHGASSEDLAEVDALDPPPSTVQDVKERLKWGSARATDALREWRSRVPHTGVQERGTPDTDGPGSGPQAVA